MVIYVRVRVIIRARVKVKVIFKVRVRLVAVSIDKRQRISADAGDIFLSLSVHCLGAASML